MSICAASRGSLEAARAERRERLALQREWCARRAELLAALHREADGDGDRVPNRADNCPGAANPEQRDFDRDGIGDYCDHDDDNDGTCDVLDPAPLNAARPGRVWLA